MAIPPQFMKATPVTSGKKLAPNLVQAARNNMASKKTPAKGKMPPWLMKK